MRQLEPSSVLDLLALSEVSDSQPLVAREMSGFADRILKEVSDIPDGPSWAEFVSEFASLEASRTPDCFRAMLRGQIEARGAGDHADSTTLVAAWDEVPAEPFQFGEVEAKIERSTKVAKPKGGGAVDDKTAAKPKKRTTQKKEVDPVRQKFIRNMCLERLRGYVENGLSEKILITGVSFAARKTYPNISPAEVVAVMKILETDGVARRTAGRWILGRVW
jgi:hypothetical protein